MQNHVCGRNYTPCGCAQRMLEQNLFLNLQCLFYTSAAMSTEKGQPFLKGYIANNTNLLWKQTKLLKGSEIDKFFPTAFKKQKVEQKRTLSCLKSGYIWFPTNHVSSNFARSKQKHLSKV